MTKQQVPEVAKKVARILAEYHATKDDVTRVMMCLDSYMVVSCDDVEEEKKTE